jgi:hypothetical protein
MLKRISFFDTVMNDASHCLEHGDELLQWRDDDWLHDLVETRSGMEVDASRG